MLLLKYTAGEAADMDSGWVGLCYNLRLVSMMLQV